MDKTSVSIEDSGIDLMPSSIKSDSMVNKEIELNLISMFRNGNDKSKAQDKIIKNKLLYGVKNDRKMSEAELSRIYIEGVTKVAENNQVEVKG